MEKTHGLRREPELPDHLDIARETPDSLPTGEFAIFEDDPDEAARASALRRRMQGLARQASQPRRRHWSVGDRDAKRY
tara:strand:- start:269 stop:502 length:234 start_codon:yes stop_codon:yes gene_type:complete